MLLVVRAMDIHGVQRKPSSMARQLPMSREPPKRDKWNPLLSEMNVTASTSGCIRLIISNVLIQKLIHFELA